MTTYEDQKVIKGQARTIAAIADEIETYSDDREMLLALVGDLYDQSEKLVAVLHKTMPKEHWLTDQFNRITLQRDTTHRSERR